MTLTGNVEFTIGGTSGNVVFSGTSATVNGGYALLASSGGGGVQFGAPVGTVTPLDSLQVVGPGGISVRGNQTVASGPMNYTGPVTLLANAIFTDSGAAGVTFSEAGGTAIAGNKNLQVWATNSSIDITGDVDLSSGSGNGGNATFTAQDGITLTGDVDLRGGSSGGNGGSTMFTAGSVSVTGDIDVSGGLGGGDAGSANINGQSGIVLEGRLIARGGDTAAGTAGDGGTAILISADGSIAIHNIDTSGGSATAAGASGGTAGIIGLMPSNATGFDNTPAATVIINEDLGSAGNLIARGGTGIAPGSNGAGALINITASRPEPVSAATITSSLAGNDITIVCRTFTMGMNEVFTALGNLSITGGNQINMGDTIALLDLTLSAPTINLAIHGTYDILNSSGVLYPNPTLHFFAGQTLSVTGTLSPSGPIDQESFASTYTTPEFNSLLIYNSANILNFSTASPPPPPPPPPGPPGPSPSPSSESSQQFAIYQLLIGDAYLSDLLHMIYTSYLPDPYRICRKPYTFTDGEPLENICN